jgi:phage gpG-like protein
MQIEVTLLGSDQMIAALEKMDLAMNDMRPMFKETLAPLFYRFEKEAFDSEGATSGAGRWAELRPGYAMQKAKRYPGRLILDATGDLRRSLTTPNARGSRLQITEQEVSIGTDIPYAGYHMTGTSNMAARPPVALTSIQEAEIARALRDGFASIGIKSGFLVVTS